MRAELHLRDLATDLDHAELLLRCVQVLVPDLDGMDPALRMQLASGLRTARRAVEAAQSPARRDLSGSGADPTAVATRGGPVQLATAETSDPAHAQVGAAAVANPAGRPPPPGGDFHLPASAGLPSFEIGVGPLYDALPTP